MSALLAKETEFWLALKTSDLFSWDLENRFFAVDAEEMTEPISSLAFPPMIVKD